VRDVYGHTATAVWWNYPGQQSTRETYLIDPATAALYAAEEIAIKPVAGMPPERC
jgi:hypothetical protein